MPTLRKGWQQVQNHGLHYYRPSQRLSACGGVIRPAQPADMLDKVKPTQGCDACTVVAKADAAKAKASEKLPAASKSKPPTAGSCSNPAMALSGPSPRKTF